MEIAWKQRSDKFDRQSGRELEIGHRVEGRAGHIPFDRCGTVDLSLTGHRTTGRGWSGEASNAWTEATFPRSGAAEVVFTGRRRRHGIFYESVTLKTV